MIARFPILTLLAVMLWAASSWTVLAAEAEDTVLMADLPDELRNKREEQGPGAAFFVAAEDKTHAVPMRRSSLDKNFIRFGRNGAARLVTFQQDANDENEDSWVSLADGDLINKPGRRSVNSNFLRFGRAGSQGAEDYSRYGRGDVANMLRFGRSVKY